MTAAANAARSASWRPQILERVLYGSHIWRIKELWTHPGIGPVATIERDVAVVYGKHVTEGLTPVPVASLEPVE